MQNGIQTIASLPTPSRQRRREKSTLALSALSLLLLPQVTRAQDIVKNGGFETGDLTNWKITKGSIQADSSNAGVPHTGSYDAFLTPTAITNGLSQTLITVPNQTYALSFWVAAYGSNTFTVLWGGALVVGAPTKVPTNPDGNTLPSDYVNYTLNVVAPSNSTTLEFDASNRIGATILDDVSAVPTAAATPEPGAVALLLGAVPGAVLLLRRRKQ